MFFSRMLSKKIEIFILTGATASNPKFLYVFGSRMPTPDSYIKWDKCHVLAATWARPVIFSFIAGAPLAADLDVIAFQKKPFFYGVGRIHTYRMKVKFCQRIKENLELKVILPVLLLLQYRSRTTPVYWQYNASVFFVASLVVLKIFRGSIILTRLCGYVKKSKLLQCHNLFSIDVERASNFRAL